MKTNEYEKGFATMLMIVAIAVGLTVSGYAMYQVMEDDGVENEVEANATSSSEVDLENDVNVNLNTDVDVSL